MKIITGRPLSAMMRQTTAPAIRETWEMMNQHISAPIELDGTPYRAVKCRVCGRLLTYRESIRRGIGPECARGVAQPSEDDVSKKTRQK